MAGYCIRVGVSGMTVFFLFLGVIQGVGVSAQPGTENTRAPWRRGSDSCLRACHTPPLHLRRRYRFFCRFRRPLLWSPSGLGAPLSQRGMGLVRLTGTVDARGASTRRRPHGFETGSDSGLCLFTLCLFQNACFVRNYKSILILIAKKTNFLIRSV